MENKSNSSSCPTFPANLEYQPGIGNHFSSEANAGALPKGQNSLLVCPFGLYEEQISGTSFTAPRKINQRRFVLRIACSFNFCLLILFYFKVMGLVFDSFSWLYRIKPSVTLEPFKPRLVPNHGKLVSEFNQSNSCATPTQLRWKPVEIPEAPTGFIDGMYTVCGAGSSYLRHGYAIHM